MKLSQLAAKPQLIQVLIDDAETIAAHGESIEFYTWDRQPLEVFMKLANSDHNDSTGMINIVRTLILDENGAEVISGENMIPSSVLIKVVAKIVELLGK